MRKIFRAIWIGAAFCSDVSSLVGLARLAVGPAYLECGLHDVGFGEAVALLAQHILPYSVDNDALRRAIQTVKGSIDFVAIPGYHRANPTINDLILSKPVFEDSPQTIGNFLTTLPQYNCLLGVRMRGRNFSREMSALLALLDVFYRIEVRWRRPLQWHDAIDHQWHMEDTALLAKTCATIVWRCSLENSLIDVDLLDELTDKQLLPVVARLRHSQSAGFGRYTFQAVPSQPSLTASTFKESVHANGWGNISNNNSGLILLLGGVLESLPRTYLPHFTSILSGGCISVYGALGAILAAAYSHESPLQMIYRGQFQSNPTFEWISTTHLPRTNCNGPYDPLILACLPAPIHRVITGTPYQPYAMAGAQAILKAAFLKTSEDDVDLAPMTSFDLLRLDHSLRILSTRHLQVGDFMAVLDAARIYPSIIEAFINNPQADQYRYWLYECLLHNVLVFQAVPKGSLSPTELR